MARICLSPLVSNFLRTVMFLLALFFGFLLFTKTVSGQTTKTHVENKTDTADKADYADVGMPLSKVHSAREHGGHNQNWTSIQSNDGLIYVGHTTGISQWDGENWHNYTTPHSTPVRSIVEFRNKLYFGTTNDIFELTLNAQGDLLATSLVSSLPPTMRDFGEVWSSAANNQGVIFVSQEYTFFFDGVSLVHVPEAVSSKHSIFSVHDNFYYKPRHLAPIHQLNILKTNAGLSYQNSALAMQLPLDARVMEIIAEGDTRTSSLLIFTERHGVYRANKQGLTQVLKPLELAADVQIYDAILSSDNYYYVSTTYSGLFILDQHLNVLRHYLEGDGISMDTVFSVNEDVQGNIWLTGIPNVVNMRPPHAISQFKAGNTSTEILRLRNTELGIFASGNGQFVLNMPALHRNTPRFTGMSNNIESSVDIMPYGSVLLKSGYGGVYELPLAQNGTAVAAENRIVETALGRSLSVDLNGHVLVSSSEGAFILKRQGASWAVDTFPAVSKPLISLMRDINDTLWLGSPTSELYKLERISQNGREASVQVFSEEDGLGLGPVSIFEINGEAVFSSAGKLFMYVNGQLKDASEVDSELPIFNADWLADSKVIDPIVQTQKATAAGQRLWYRKNGFSGYFEQTQQGSWVEHTAIFDSIESGGFNDLFVTDNDILWFVRDKAQIYRVDIEALKQPPELAALNIRRIEVNQQTIEFNVDSIALPILEPEQNNVRVSYASTDSASPDAIQYRSRMLGPDNVAWSVWSTETYRDFTQLSPGTYVFEVEAKDAWKRAALTKASFTILTPWYLSKAAYIVYIVFALILLFAFAYIVQKWRTKSLEAANEELENKVDQRTKEVNEKVELLRQQQILKDRFFGNVSHEFRTPLTLTIGPLEALLSEHKSVLSEPVSHLARTALNNASKMLALVGQVLDLNRLEAGKLPLRIAQYDIAELLRNIKVRFEPWATQQKQVINIVNCDEPLLLWFDMDQIDKCVSNLLSNAIKYSGEGSIIEIELNKQLGHVDIAVSDNGLGISEGAKDKVFERFYQDKSSESIAAPGTGIGLALVKEIMEIHYGDAKLLTPAKRGCCFVLSLKLGNTHFHSAQIIEPINMHAPNSRALQEPTLPSTGNHITDLAATGDNQDLTTLLIVDDNVELLNFISLRLSASYRIIQAMNGKEGYQKACEELPDLIVSDVNMPIMTGLELAEQIKANQQTRTIPIILLTAKASKREVVAGFSVGADDYLTKPFDTSELIMRVNAQINSRKMVRDAYISDVKLSKTSHAKGTFKRHILNLIEGQLAEPSFNVVQLAKLMHMSRDTLIRKCKKECGDTPLKLIVDSRMHKADELLQQQTMSVSEVAYACGFESLAYFSKSYKKHRGIAPSAFVASN